MPGVSITIATSKPVPLAGVADQDINDHVSIPRAAAVEPGSRSVSKAVDEHAHDAILTKRPTLDNNDPIPATHAQLPRPPHTYTVGQAIMNHSCLYACPPACRHRNNHYDSSLKFFEVS